MALRVHKKDSKSVLWLRSKDIGKQLDIEDI